jgi:hypothetical protein
MTKSKQDLVAENIQDFISRADDFGQRVQSEAAEVGNRLRSGLEDMDLNEATIPDAFRNAPKFISPKVHRWLDVAVTGYFAVLAVWFAVRGKKGPAVAAGVNAGMVASVSMLTDYDGTKQKPISFKLHGTLDAVQATTAALGPVLHGFAGDPESVFFYGQAANELAVISSTDWDAGMPRRSRHRKAA